MPHVHTTTVKAVSWAPDLAVGSRWVVYAWEMTGTVHGAGDGFIDGAAAGDGFPDEPDQADALQDGVLVGDGSPPGIE